MNERDAIPRVQARNVNVREMTMVNVTKSNFLEESQNFIKRLPQSAWISIDEEMTGIMLPGTKAGRLSKDETPADRYPDLKAVPERYSIIQLGVCLFEKVEIKENDDDDDDSENPTFDVRRYKFTMFPPADSKITREIVLNPSSIHFLTQNNMNLDHWAREGIPFCDGGTASGLLNTFYEQQTKAASKNTKSPSFNRRRVELTRDEDKNFHARAMAGLREWLDSAIVPQEDDIEGASYLLPPCNSFMRRALYESIPSEYPNLVVETFQGSQIRVWRLNAQEKERRSQRLLREGYEKLILEKIGVWRIFLALSKACRGEGPSSQAEHMILANCYKQAMESFDGESQRSSRKIPLVVHNGLHDLLFLFTHFYRPTLPEKWEQCKELIHSYFPVVYDTKIMAAEYRLSENLRIRTHLGAVYEETIANQPQWDRPFLVDGREQLQEQVHDAAFDAYMTGAAFYWLSTLIHDQLPLPAFDTNKAFEIWDLDTESDEAAWFYGRNKLHFHLSPYTIDLESPLEDPLGKGMSHCSTFRVAGIPTSTTTRDIIRSLSGLTDSQGRRVDFEITWVNDSSFIVGAMMRECRDEGIFQEHGKILSSALKNRFENERIEPLRPIQVSEKGQSIWNLWGWFGTSKRALEIDETFPNKRRRTS